MSATKREGSARSDRAAGQAEALRNAAITKQVIGWANENLRDFPWRRRTSGYEVLLAEMILRRTTASAAIHVYERVLRMYPSPRALANARLPELQSILRRVGYQHQRARQFKETAAEIVNSFGGDVPLEPDHLMSIPHVGPYTVGAILSLSARQPATMVDSNVERVLSRVFADSDFKRRVPSHREITEYAQDLLPRRGFREFNLGLIDLGALVCRPRNPKCPSCPLLSYCDTGHRRAKARRNQFPRGKS